MAPRRMGFRRAGFRRAALGAALGLSLAVAGAPASAQISLLGLKNTLVQFALERISVPGSFEITAEGVTEPEDGVTELQGLAIADADGVWFRAEAVSLKWTPSRILAGALDIDSLAARNVQVLRRPLPVAVEINPESELAQDRAPFSWPRAPIATRIGELRLDHVAVAAGVIAAQSLDFDASGAARDEGDIQALTFQLTRSDAVSGAISLAYERDFAADTLTMRLTADEAAGGLVAELGGLPDDSASSVRIDAEGPLSGWKMRLSASVERMIDVAGRATLDVLAPVSGEIALTLTPGPALSAAARAALAPAAQLDLAVSEGEAGVIRIERGVIASAALSMTASGDYVRDTGAVALDVALEARRAMAALIEGVDFASVGFDGKVGGRLDDLDASGALTLAELTTAPADVGAARLDMTVNAVTRANAPAPRVTLRISGEAEALRLDRLGPEIIGRADLRASGVYDGAVAELSALDFVSPLLTLGARGRVDLAAQALSAEYRLQTPDLAGVAMAYGVDAAGRANVAGTAEGPVAALLLDGEARLEDLAFEGDSYGAVSLRHRVTIAGTIAGNAALKAGGSPLGPVSAGGDFKLDGQVLTLTGLTASALDTDIAGDATIRLDTRLVDGALTLEARDLAAYEALTPFAGTALATLGAPDLAGTLSGDVALRVEDGRQAARLKLAGAGIAGFGARLRRLDLAGDVQDAFGAASASGAAQIAGLDLGPLGGGARLADLDLDGSLDDLGGAGTVKARMAARGLELGETAGGAGAARLDLRLTARDLTGAPGATVELTAEDLALGALAGNGALARLTLSGEGRDLLASPAGALRLTAESLDFGDLAPGGRIARLSLDATGTDLTGAPSVVATLIADNIAPGDLAPGKGVAKATLVAKARDLIAAPAGTARLRLDDLDLAGLRAGLVDLDATLARESAGARLTASLRAPDATAEGLQLRGVALDADLRDALGAPVLDVTAGAARLRAGTLDLTRLKAAVKGPLEALVATLALSGRAGDAPVSGTARATLDVSDADGPQGEITRLDLRRGDARIALRAPLTIARAPDGTALRNIDLRLPGGGLRGEVTIHDSGLSGDLRLRLPDLPAAAKLVGAPMRSGDLSASARFDTRPETPGADLALDLTKLQFEAALFEGESLALDLKAAWDGARLTAGGALSGPFGDPLRLSAALPLRPAGMVPAPPPGARLDARLRWNGEIGAFWGLVPAPDHVLNGRLDLDVGVSGPLDNLHPAGRVNLADGRYENLETGTILTDLTVTTRIDGKADLALDLSASDGSGSRLTARAALSGDAIDAALRADNAILVRRDDVAAAISADLTVKGPLVAPAIAGEVVIERAEIRLINAAPPSVADLGDIEIRGAPREKARPGRGGGPTLDLGIRAPDEIFVRGRGLDSEWMMDLRVKGAAADPAITGRIEKRRGRLDFIGHDFDLATGKLTFGGARPPDPEIDVAMELENNGILGRIAVRGFASDPEIAFESRPGLPEDEVLPRLLFNNSLQSLSAAQAVQIAAGIATLMSGQEGVLGGVRAAAGLDVLGVDQQDGETSVRVGKNVAEGVFVGARQPVNGGGTVIEVEVEIFDDFIVDSEVSDEKGATLGIQWKKDF